MGFCESRTCSVPDAPCVPARLCHRENPSNEQLLLIPAFFACDFKMSVKASLRWCFGVLQIVLPKTTSLPSASNPATST